MAMAPGNGNGNVGALRFTLSQVLQLLALLLAGVLAWGNLKGDIREGFATVNGRIDRMDDRVRRVERQGNEDDTPAPRTSRHNRTH